MTEWRRRLSRRLGVLFGKARVERELDEELAEHIRLEARELERGGMTPEAARREALRRFGGVERTKERVRDERGGRVLDDFVQDVRFGGRSLRRSPGFTLSALVVLTIGIGSAVTLFAVVDTVLLEPLPYGSPERIVRVWPSSPSRGIDRAAVSYPDFLDWRQRTRTLDGLAVYSTLPSDYAYHGGDEPVEIATEWVAGDYFEVLGVSPLLGRTLTQADAEVGLHAVVLSHGLWQRMFAADPGVLGSTIQLDYRSFEIVGVMPEGFTYPEGETIDIWVPLTVIPEDDIPIGLRPVRFLQMVGRLAPGTAIPDATADLSDVARGLEAEYPDVNAGVNAATVLGLQEWVVGDVRRSLLVTLGAVGLILLLACANVANLLLARGTSRSTEVALRMSLGAPAERIVRQLLTESLLLSVTGAGAGLGLAWMATRLLAANAGDLLPRAGAIGLDGTVIGVSVLVGLAAAALAGVLPALRAADVTPARDLRADARSGGGGRGAVALRRTLVGAEVAFAVLLLTGAGLLLRSLEEMRSVDPGFETGNRIAMTITIADMKYPTRPEWQAVYHEILDRLAAHPDVISAGAIRYLPFRGGGEALAVRVEGLYEPAPEEQRYASMLMVSDDLMDALGMRLLRGRDIEPTDDATNPPVVVVNEAFQRDFFMGEDPLGRRFAAFGQEIEVVGVVADVRQEGITADPEPTVYISNDQVARIQASYVVHTSGDPLAMVPEMRRIVAEIDAEQPISEFVPLAELAAENLARPRFFTWIMGAFALVALVLAALGVYGVLAYTVRSRVRDTGLRLALGASAASVARRVVAQGMTPVLVGLAVGLAASLALAGLLESLLFGVTPLDAATHAAVVVVLGVVGIVACAVPAWSACRVDPMVSIRAE